MADLPTLIQNRIVEAVVANCQTPFPTTEPPDEDNPDWEPDPDWKPDPSRANLVKKGAFQDDPSDYIGIVCIHRNNPKKTKDTGEAAWPDVRIGVEMGAVIGAPATCHWMRRFAAEVQFWPAGMTQVEAEEANGVLVARVRNSIEKLELLGLHDEFGESVEQPTNPIVRMQFDEGGGPDDEYSWKTTLFLEYMTVWNPV
jgi:hypothetical protein